MSKERWGEGNIYLRGNIYWVRYSVDGKDIAVSAKTSKAAEARRFLRGKIAQKDNGHKPTAAINKTTVADLLADLRADYVRREQAVSFCDIVIRHLLHEDSPLRFMKAAAVGTKALNAYAAWRRQTVAGPTVNREMALLRRAFHLGMKHDPPKAARCPAFTMFAESAPRKGFFDREMLGRLMAALPPEIASIALFAFYTGCRRGEILKARWDWLDEDGANLRIPGEFTKNGEPRVIPLAAEVRARLAAMKTERDDFWPHSPWIFSRAGRPIKRYRRTWDKACAAANLPDGTKYLHDMRRSAVRNLVRAGVSETVAMRISGHKTRGVFTRYNIVTEADLSDAVARLEKHVQSGTPAAANLVEFSAAKKTRTKDVQNQNTEVATG